MEAAARPPKFLARRLSEGEARWTDRGGKDVHREDVDVGPQERIAPVSVAPMDPDPVDCKALRRLRCRSGAAKRAGGVRGYRAE